MPDVSDMELLQDYARNGSETAFAELVRRHVSLVYSAALRQVGIAAHAEEISQVVFVILAQKAARLRPDTILEGWLYQTARLTALSFLRGERRRQRREQEACMQSALQESGEPVVWNQFAPLLDQAMARLGKTDREAVVLRYFKGKSLHEVAAALKITEAAAQSRVHRSVGKLQKFFLRHGIHSTTAAIAVAISANSVMAAPAGLAKTISAVAVAKGAAAGTSTLTLVKGALKLMAWTKAKTAVVTSAVVLLAAGTTAIAVKEIQEHRDSSWELSNFDPVPVVVPTVLGKTPPQVRIVPSKYNHWVMGPFTSGDSSNFVNGKWVPATTNASISMGVGVTVDDMVRTAYEADDLHTLFATEIPRGRYDYIANIRRDALLRLRSVIREKFDLVGKWEMMETNVLALRIADPDKQAFKPANSMRPNVNKLDAATLASSGSDFKHTKDGSAVDIRFNTPVSFIVEEMENNFNLPIVNQTGLTNRYDYAFTWPVRRTGDNQAWERILRNALRNQLGLELVPTNMPVKMLVVEQAKK